VERIPWGTAMRGTQLSLRNSPETAFEETKTPAISAEISLPRSGPSRWESALANDLPAIGLGGNFHMRADVLSDGVDVLARR
jgi:hypothetical protein